MGTALPDNDLLQLLHAKEKSAFSSVYDIYAPPLFGIICKLVKDDTIAEKVLRRTFINMWQQSETLKDHKGSVFAWMQNISRNAVMEELEKIIKKDETIKVEPAKICSMGF